LNKKDLPGGITKDLPRGIREMGIFHGVKDILQSEPAVDPVGRRRGNLEYIFTWGNECHFEYLFD